MALTRDQIIQKLAKRKLAQRLEQGTWGSFASSIQALSSAEKALLVGYVKSGAAERLGRELLRAYKTHQEVQAVQDVEALLIDDSLSLAELESLL